MALCLPNNCTTLSNGMRIFGPITFEIYHSSFLPSLLLLTVAIFTCVSLMFFIFFCIAMQSIAIDFILAIVHYADVDVDAVHNHWPLITGNNLGSLLLHLIWMSMGDNVKKRRYQRWRQYHNVTKGEKYIFHAIFTLASVDLTRILVFISGAHSKFTS